MRFFIWRISTQCLNLPINEQSLILLSLPCQVDRSHEKSYQSYRKFFTMFSHGNEQRISKGFNSNNIIKSFKSKINHLVKKYSFFDETIYDLRTDSKELNKVNLKTNVYYTDFYTIIEKNRPTTIPDSSFFLTDESIDAFDAKSSELPKRYLERLRADSVVFDVPGSPLKSAHEASVDLSVDDGSLKISECFQRLLNKVEISDKTTSLEFYPFIKTKTTINFFQKKDDDFAKIFKSNYRPGIFGGRVGRLLKKGKPFTKEIAISLARAKPNSATAKALDKMGIQY